MMMSKKLFNEAVELGVEQHLLTVECAKCSSRITLDWLRSSFCPKCGPVSRDKGMLYRACDDA